jgi:hypothetical protein
MDRDYLKLLPKNFEQAPWYWIYMDTMSKNRHSINRQITCLNLKQTSSFDDVQNDVYITLHHLSETNKLIYDPDNHIFTYILENGTKNEIKNFKSWIRTISFNYLKKLRRERNKIENSINIDDCYVRNKVCTEVLKEHLSSKEIREKVNLLKKLDRRIIELCFFEGYKFEEISNKLEEEGLGTFNAVTLRQRKCRALEKLRKHFLPQTNN